MADQDLKELSLKDLSDSVSRKYEADVVLYSGEISDTGYGKLVEIILQNKRHENLILIITTNGGSGNAAYAIARFIQKIYAKFYLYAPSYCKSAGTLIALGANELIMDTFSELGPLDVQLMKQNEIGARKSGLLTRAAMEGLSETSFELFETLMLRILRKSGGLVSFRLASDLSANMASSLMAGVFHKIDPDVVGSDRRDLDVALEYGYRLIEASENATATTVRHLVNHYPSHDFIIDDEEARGLFENVSYPEPELMTLSGFLGKLAYDEASDILVMSMNEIESEEGDGSDDRREGTDAVATDAAANDRDPGDAGSDDRASDPEPQAGEDRPQKSTGNAEARASRRQSQRSQQVR